MVSSFQGFIGDMTQRFPVLSDQSHMYNLTILVAALVAGFVVYAVLQGLTKLLSVGLNDYIAVQEASEAEKKHAAKEAVMRWSLRGTALVGWILYWVFFAGVILPFCILLARIDVADLFTVMGWVNGFLIGRASVRERGCE